MELSTRILFMNIYLKAQTVLIRNTGHGTFLKAWRNTRLITSYLMPNNTNNYENKADHLLCYFNMYMLENHCILLLLSDKLILFVNNTRQAVFVY